MKAFVVFIALLCANPILAHNYQSQVKYLANEALLITGQNTKILFDPLFLNTFNTYQKVPDEMLQKLFANEEPFQNINAIFISHAHGDHFAAQLIFEYLLKHSDTQLIAPSQAIEMVSKLDTESQVNSQLHPISIQYKDPPQTIDLKNLFIEIIRIPHSGWPTRRLDVSNLLYRVTLDDSLTVIHMGDADPNDTHFAPYEDFWKATLTDMSFPPYWFYYSTYGPKILEQRINTAETIGVHVPVNVPIELINTGKKFFSNPGEVLNIEHKH